ncbi:MAG: GlsB/YeaQ/YmgE family stress response membrane protein [Aeromicrobium sp.]
MGIIGFIIVGLIAGFIARAVVPGKDDFGILGTILLGIVGSFVGGFLGSLVGGGGVDLTAAGIIGSIIGAIVALLVYNAVTGRKKNRV